MKKTATQAGNGQEANSDHILPANPRNRSSITLDIPPDLITFCDERAQALCLSRSAFIRSLLIRYREALATAAKED